MSWLASRTKHSDPSAAFYKFGLTAVICAKPPSVMFVILVALGSHNEFLAERANLFSLPIAPVGLEAKAQT